MVSVVQTVVIHNLKPGQRVKVAGEERFVCDVTEAYCPKHPYKGCKSTVIVWAWSQRGKHVSTVACSSDMTQRYEVIERGAHGESQGAEGGPAGAASGRVDGGIRSDAAL